MSTVWLRNAGDGEDDCWVPCAKGDPGATEFVPVVPTQAMIQAGFHEQYENGGDPDEIWHLMIEVARQSVSAEA